MSSTIAANAVVLPASFVLYSRREDLPFVAAGGIIIMKEANLYFAQQQQAAGIRRRCI